MDGTAIVIDLDGTVRRVTLPEQDKLRAMYEAIRCDRVDVVALTDKLDMWLDDEGMYNHPVNPYATELARRFGFVYQDYYGPVLLCGRTDQGDSINLTTEQANAALAQVTDVLVNIGGRL